MAGAQIRRFLILHKELDADDGELTRTRKVRRGFIGERYTPLVEALYGGCQDAPTSRSTSPSRTAARASIEADVEIRDVAPMPLPRLAAPQRCRSSAS